MFPRLVGLILLCLTAIPASCADIARRGALPTAAISSGNPSGVVYVARLLNPPNTNIGGFITAYSPGTGNGVDFDVHFEGLPKNQNIRMSFFPVIIMRRISPNNKVKAYHIHNHPVDGTNCSTTGDHLDPQKRGESPPCNTADPKGCQLGDLSGKHGVAFSVNGDPFETHFNDPYVSLRSNSSAYFGNLSVVLHYPGLAKLTCGNFMKI